MATHFSHGFLSHAIGYDRDSAQDLFQLTKLAKADHFQFFLLPFFVLFFLVFFFTSVFLRSLLCLFSVLFLCRVRP